MNKYQQPQKQFTLPPEMMEEFNKRFHDRMDRMLMSWNDELQLWHGHAMKALNFCRVREVPIQQKDFIKLLEYKASGINMNVVMALCNVLEDRSAAEMGYMDDLERWSEVLILNSKIAVNWQALSLPANQEVIKEIEILVRQQRNKIVVVPGNGMPQA